MKTLFGTLLGILFFNMPLASATDMVKVVVCDVRVDWDSGNRPIEEGSLIAEMVLERLNGSHEKIEITERDDAAAHWFKFKDVQGFATPTRFIDDLFTPGNIFKFRGFLLQNVIVAGQQLLFVKGYFRNCTEE